MKRIATAFVLSAILAGHCFSDENNPQKLTVSGRVALDAGQIVNGHYLGQVDPFRLWIYRGFFNVRLQTIANDKLVVVAEPEVKVWFNTYPSTMITGPHTNVPFQQYATVTIADGEGIYSFFGNESPKLRFAAGFFPIKYNPDAKNLGEYLFRTGAYPSYVLNAFEFQFARLAGFHLSSTLFNCLQQDLMLHSETQVLPLHDWSLSYLANADFKMFEIGAGISLHHWFTVDNQFTQPKNSYNLYFTESGDSAWFSFKGIKLAARFAFDPKRLMPSVAADRFGKNDLRLYTEAAFLGVKDYSASIRQTTLDAGGNPDTVVVPDTNKSYYSDKFQRMPIMIGFNFPTFKMLDYLTFEIESYTWAGKNCYYDQQNQYFFPTPPVIIDPVTYTKEAYKYDTWKWSVNIKKTVAQKFSITGQIARDHMRQDVWQEGQRDPEEALTRSNEWCWMVRLQYNF